MLREMERDEKKGRKRAFAKGNIIAKGKRDLGGLEGIERRETLEALKV